MYLNLHQNNKKPFSNCWKKECQVQRPWGRNKLLRSAILVKTHTLDAIQAQGSGHWWSRCPWPLSFCAPPALVCRLEPQTGIGTHGWVWPRVIGDVSPHGRKRKCWGLACHSCQQLWRVAEG
jgi:hypothetical protein